MKIKVLGNIINDNSNQIDPPPPLLSSNLLTNFNILFWKSGLLFHKSWNYLLPASMMGIQMKSIKLVNTTILIIT